jgi:hypothetical protein
LISSFVAVYLSNCLCSKINNDINYENFNSVPDTHSNVITDQNNKITNEESVKDCYSLSPLQCLKCGQCGIYQKDGISKCVPGDVYGPSFTSDADYWIYGNSYDRYIYGEDVVSRYKPWNKDAKMNITDFLGLFY